MDNVQPMPANVHANTEAVPFDFESAEALTMHLKYLTQASQIFTR